MSVLQQDAVLRLLSQHENTSLYALQAPSFVNHYYLISSPGTRRLMAFPEVVGYDKARAAMSIFSPSSGAD